jgi:deazaflavin-dependent oxidoreductase (nitroreductase family)
VTTTDEALRRGFHYGNKAMLLGWRLGAGSFMNRAWLSGQIMVVTHVGRSSGRVYRTPVNYARGDCEVFCIAGFGRSSDWYRNVIARPQVEIWLPSERFGGPVAWWEGVAEPVGDDPERIVRLREVLVASGFAGRLDGFRPSMTDDALRAMGADYPVIRMRLTDARTGDGGPSDLAACWQAAATVMVPLAVRGLARRRSAIGA